MGISPTLHTHTYISLLSSSIYPLFILYPSNLTNHTSTKNIQTNGVKNERGRGKLEKSSFVEYISIKRTPNN